MKKNHYFYYCLALLASTVLWTCHREFDQKPSETAVQLEEFSVAEARENFEKNPQYMTVQGINQNDSNRIRIMALWKLANSLKSNDISTVETPLNIIPYYSWVDGKYDPISHGRILVNTLTYLIVQKNGMGEIDYRVAKFIGDDDYMINKPRKFFESPLSALLGFSGKVIYYDLEGIPLEGIVYKDGRQLGVLFPVEGKAKSTLRGDSSDESLNHECFTIKWKNATRDGIDLPEVIIIGKPAPFDPSPCYYNGNGSDGWGGGGGGGGSGSGSSGGGSDIGSGHSSGSISIQLSQTTMSMGTNYTITSTINNNAEVSYISYIIIDKATNQEYILESTSQKTLYTRAYRPGNYTVKAHAFFIGKASGYSNSVDMTVQFLHQTEMLASQTLKGMMDNEWALTKMSDGNGNYAERGCAIYFNTASNSYSFGPQSALDWRDPCKAALMRANIEVSWTDYGDPRQGSKYFVGTFHTHLPYLCGSGDRPVGPSGMDETQLGNNVNFVYDYVGINGDLLGTHGIHDAAKVYHFGLERGHY